MMSSAPYLAHPTSTTGERNLRFAYIPLLALTGRWPDAHAEADGAMQEGTPGSFRMNLLLILGELAYGSGESEVAGHTYPHTAAGWPASRFADAEAHLDVSLALADACAAPYERALTLLAMTELRAGMGENEAVRTLLEEVCAICAPLGAQPTLARADTVAEKIATKSA